MPSQRPPYPPGSLNANGFNLFNAVSFQITLGAPLVLLAKSLDASALMIGFLAALTPVMNICQLPAAHFITRFGYRRFVLAGWSIRSVFIFAIAAVPIFPSLADSGRLVLLAVFLFAFTTLRGISSAAWFPWITELIPESLRAGFLARDQIFMHFGSLAALIGAAWILGSDPAPGAFALLFFCSALAAVVSLFFLKRMPDADAPEAMKRSGQSVPWRAIFGHRPFRGLLGVNMMVLLVVGGAGVFCVAWLKLYGGMNDGGILRLASMNFLGAIVALSAGGKVTDACGPRVVLGGSLVALAVVLGGWWAFAAGVVEAGLYAIGAVFFLSGVAGALFNLANVRIAMSTMPPMGRTHFFAMFTVVSGLVLGISPLLWGWVVDASGWMGLRGSGYPALFATGCLGLLVAAALCRVLVAPPPTVPFTTDHAIQAQIRRWSRFWQR